MLKERSKELRQPAIGISQSKKRTFTVITAATPIVVLVLLELGLRLFSYGPNLALFTTEEIGSKTYHIMNPDVKFRYFTHVEFSPNTSPDYFLVPKPKGMYRIFCLGGSTTIGFPYGPIGSFSTFLRDRLRSIFPEKQIEVINLGMTATNSYTAADIARDLMNFEPDLIIDYDGHNEFYGALGIGSNESAGGSRFLTKLYLRLVHVRTFILLRSVMEKLKGVFSSGNQQVENGTLMERLSKGQYIPYNSSTYRKGLEFFRANLSDLIEICASHRVPLILSPQVSNLRGQAPFVSEFRVGLSPQIQNQYNGNCAIGKSYWKEGRVDSALAEFRIAAFLDSGRADAHYFIAQCLDSLGQTKEAKEEYLRARDLDQLRFRASSDFNEAIREAAMGPGIYFAPLEEIMANNARDGIIGNDLILEHLHPRLEGNFLIAKEYAHLMQDRGLLTTYEEWVRRDTVSDQNLWNNRPLTQVDELAAEVRVARLTSEWPFTQRSVIQDSSLLDGPLGTIVKPLVDGQTTWERAHVAAAEYYQTIADLKDTEREYQVLINQLQYNISAYLLLGQLYGIEKKFESATEVLTKSLAVESSYEAYEMLGKIQIIQNHPADAIPFLERSYSLSPTPDQRTSAGYFLALSKARSGKTDDAKTLLQEILRLNPTLNDARALLNSLNAKPS